MLTQSFPGRVRRSVTYSIALSPRGSKDTGGPEVQKMFCFRVGGTKLKGSRAGLSGPDRVCIFEARPRRREPLSLHILISVVSKSYDNGSCVCQVLCVFYPELSLGQT